MRFPDQVRELLLVNQQLARPKRIVIVNVAVGIMGDVRILQPQFPRVGPDVRLADISLAGSNRLGFGAREGQPGLERLEDMVVVERTTIVNEIPIRHGEL